MSRRRVPRAPRADQIAPIRRGPATVSLEEARAVLAAADPARKAPGMRAPVIRDRALLAVVAEAGLPGNWVARLVWADVLDGPCRALRLRGEGVPCHVGITADLLETLEAWRRELGWFLGRPARGDEPLFPRLGHGMRLRGADVLPAMSASYIQQVVLRYMVVAGVDESRRSLRFLRASIAVRDEDSGDGVAA